MKLMRLGAVGAERPVARIDGTPYVDVFDAVTDYDEAFVGWLAPGDVIELGIDAVGTRRQTVIGPR